MLPKCPVSHINDIPVFAAERLASRESLTLPDALGWQECEQLVGHLRKQEKEAISLCRAEDTHSIDAVIDQKFSDEEKNAMAAWREVRSILIARCLDVFRPQLEPWKQFGSPRAKPPKAKGKTKAILDYEYDEQGLLIWLSLQLLKDRKARYHHPDWYQQISGAYFISRFVHGADFFQPKDGSDANRKRRRALESQDPDYKWFCDNNPNYLKSLDLRHHFKELEDAKDIIVHYRNWQLFLVAREWSNYTDRRIFELVKEMGIADMKRCKEDCSNDRFYIGKPDARLCILLDVPLSDLHCLILEESLKTQR